MPNLLITICNMRPQQPSGLVEIDIETGSRRRIALGLAEGVLTCTGLAADSARVYVLSETASYTTFLSILRRDDYEVESVHELREVKDGHSIAVSGNSIFVVSTGTDEILAYAIDGLALSYSGIAWRVAEGRKDTHHLNAVATMGEGLLVTGFGEKSGQTWSSAIDGYLFNIGSEKQLLGGIYQPHSICVANDEVYFCESARGRIATVSGRSWEIKGYLRGLANLGADCWAVGSNVTRKVSKSTGIENNPADTGSSSLECGIGIFDLVSENPRQLGWIDLGEFGKEVYDLLCVYPSSGTMPKIAPVFARRDGQIAENAAGMNEDGAELGSHVQQMEFAHEIQLLRAQLEEANCKLTASEQELEIARRELSAMRISRDESNRTLPQRLKAWLRIRS